MNTCKMCEKEFDGSVETIAEIGEVCPECFEKWREEHPGAWECDNCDEWHECEDDCEQVETESGTQTWCEDCITGEAWHCERCGELFSNDICQEEVNTTNGTEWWCRGCAESHASRCDHCGEWFEHDRWGGTELESVIARYGRTEEWCNDCRSNSARYCGRCDEMYSTEYYDTCPNCGGREGINQVMDYHAYKGHYVPRAVGKEEKLYYGVEVETGNDPGLPWGELEPWLDDEENSLIHFEHDGSIDGPEMISQPCTLEYHQRELNWKDLCRIMVHAGYRAHNISTSSQQVGIHIHITRRKDLLRTMQKLDYYVHNDKAIWAHIGRRDEIYNCGWGPTISPMKMKYILHDTERYRPVNFRNPDTVELRTPRGSLNSDTILGTIEWLDAVIHALKDIPIRELDPGMAPETTKTKIIPFVLENRKRYPHIAKKLMNDMLNGEVVISTKHTKCVELRAKEEKKEAWLKDHQPGQKKQKVRVK